MFITWRNNNKCFIVGNYRSLKSLRALFVVILMTSSIGMFLILEINSALIRTLAGSFRSSLFGPRTGESVSKHNCSIGTSLTSASRWKQFYMIDNGIFNKPLNSKKMMVGLKSRSLLEYPVLHFWYCPKTHVVKRNLLCALKATQLLVDLRI